MTDDSFLNLIKSMLVLTIPALEILVAFLCSELRKDMCVISDVRQKVCNVMNEATELVHFLCVMRMRPVDNVIGLLRIGFNTTMSGDVVSQEIYLCLE